MLYHLSPSEIQFLQNSISDRFSDDCDKNLEETFLELLYGTVKVDDMKNLAAVEEDGTFWIVSGNRRLYLYRRLEHYGLIDTLPVFIVEKDVGKFNAMKTTKNNGQRVAVRSDRFYPVGNKMTDRLNRIYRQWDSDGRPRNGQLPAYDINEERSRSIATNDVAVENNEDHQYSDYCEDFDVESDDDEIQLEDRIDLLDDIDDQKLEKESDEDDKNKDSVSSQSDYTNSRARGRGRSGYNYPRGSRGRRPNPNHSQDSRPWYGNQYSEGERRGRGSSTREGGRRGSGTNTRGRGGRRGGRKPVAAWNPRVADPPAMMSTEGRGDYRASIDEDRQFEFPTSTPSYGQNFGSTTRNVNTPSLMRDGSFVDRDRRSLSEVENFEVKPLLSIRDKYYNSSTYTSDATAAQKYRSDTETEVFPRPNSASSRPRLSLPMSRTQNSTDTLEGTRVERPALNQHWSYEQNISPTFNTYSASSLTGLTPPISDVRVTESKQSTHPLLQSQLNSHDTHQLGARGVQKNSEPPAALSPEYQTKTLSSASFTLKSTNNVLTNVTGADAHNVSENRVSKEAVLTRHKYAELTLRKQTPVSLTNHAANISLQNEALMNRPVRTIPDRVESRETPDESVSLAEFLAGLDVTTKSYLETFPNDERLREIQRMRTDYLYKTEIQRRAKRLMESHSGYSQEAILEQVAIEQQLDLAKKLQKQEIERSARAYASSIAARQTLVSRNLSTTSTNSTNTTSTTNTTSRPAPRVSSAYGNPRAGDTDTRIPLSSPNPPQRPANVPVEQPSKCIIS